MSNVINTVPFSGSSTRPRALICTISTGNDRLYFPGLHKVLKMFTANLRSASTYPSKLSGRKELAMYVFATGPGYCPIINKVNIVS